jgi:hypothetical protein
MHFVDVFRCEAGYSCFEVECDKTEVTLMSLTFCPNVPRSLRVILSSYLGKHHGLVITRMEPLIQSCLLRRYYFVLRLVDPGMSLSGLTKF